jgi:ribonuclease VapC
MVIDTSALIAILRREPEAKDFRRSIYDSRVKITSAMTKLETSMVAAGQRGPGAFAELDALLADLGVEVVAFTDHHAMIARDAFIRYGKGRHPAALNFGDCASYALAIAEAEPLLFKGADFGATDVRVVEQG